MSHEEPDDWSDEPPPPVEPPEAARAVRGPATALAVAGWLGIAVGVARMFIHLILVAGILTVPGGAPRGAAMRAFAVCLPIAIDAVFIAWGVFVVVGAGRLRRRRGYGLALAGAIVALVPANYCWLLGLPFRIWALVVLNRPEVKEAFAARGG